MNRVIEIESLTKRYGKYIAIRDFDLDIYRGEIIAITGANGAGKSTLLKILCGVLKEWDGTVTIGGVSRRERKLPLSIGYMSQTAALLDGLTAWENYHFYGVVNGLSNSEMGERFDSASEALDLMRFKNLRIEALTSGWRQLLSFSIAIMGQPQILLLDEPTAGVDVVTRKKLWERIYAMADDGCTILVTTHHLSEAKLCNREVVIERPEQF